jgi:hypothetical protein
MTTATTMPPRAGRADAHADVPGNVSGIAAARTDCLDNGVPGSRPRYDMRCPDEALKMTPVSLYNCASTVVLEKEGL